MIVRTELFANKVSWVTPSMQVYSKAILCLNKESADFEAADAYDETTQKGRETTELLTVNDAFMNVKSYTDFFCMTLGDALRAISVGERCAYAWTSQPTYFGDVFFMFEPCAKEKLCQQACKS